MAQSVADLIREKRKALESKRAASTKALHPQPGKHRYRILPSWRADDGSGNAQPFWHDFGLHFVRTGAANKVEAVYICTDKTFGEECKICAAIGRGILTSGDDELNDRLKQANAGQKFLMNVLHLSGPEPNKPQLFEIGVTVFEQITEIMEEYGDITDLSKGMDINITRSGTGFDTTYTVVPAAKSEKVDPSVMAGVMNIDNFVNQKNATNENRALTAVARLLGIEAAPAVAARPPAAALTHGKSVAEELAEDPEVIEVSDAEDASVSTMEASDEDELDSLLNDLETDAA